MDELYADANVVLGLLTEDALAGPARDLVERWPGSIVFSDFAKAECASVVARRVRTGEMSEAQARRTFENLDHWAAAHVVRIEIEPADLRQAESMLRTMSSPLRTPDALHLAVVRRLGATLATFDVKLARAAEALAIVVAK